jgi:hypothetical protein
MNITYVPRPRDTEEHALGEDVWVAVALGAEHVGRRWLVDGSARRMHGSAEENEDSIEEGYRPFTDGYMCVRYYTARVSMATNLPLGMAGAKCV